MTTWFRSLLIAAVVLPVAGCGVSGTTGSSAALLHSVTGNLHGGQQPIAGASIALYAAGTAGIGSQARSMLTQPVTTTAAGNFTLTDLYNCNPGDQIYLVATGGDAGGGVNPSIALMAALGPCSTYQANAANVFINVDEVTTVGSVFALSGFMTGIQNVGTDAAHVNELAAAFANVGTLVSVSSGQAPTVSTGQGVVPQATINSLANSLANCINSTPPSPGAVSDECTSLFQAAKTATNTPADYGGRLRSDIALVPAGNPSAVFLQAPAASPFQPTLSAAPATYALSVQHPSDVLMYHNDIARSGVQSDETVLTPANVNTTQFGLLATYTVDSYLFAQPLYVGGLGMPDGLVHNVVYVASTRGTVYAFDADGSSTTPLWTINYIPSGERYPYTQQYYNCSNPPEAGIVGTPVIDRSTLTMYFVLKTSTTAGAPFTHRLFAVSLLDGSNQPGSPTVIAPSFAGTGSGASSGVIAFDPEAQNDRSALLLTATPTGQKTVWVDYASHCDAGNYHGLVLGFDGGALNLTATFNDTPNGNDGGIWGSNGGLVADAQGYIYALAGNGTFDANTGGADYGDSALKLAPPASGANGTQMTVADYFTPSNEATLEKKDLDLGGAEPLLINDPASGVAPTLMVATDKNGYVYLLNTTTGSMGKFDTGSNGPDGMNGDLEDFGGFGGFIWNNAFFDNMLFTSNPLRSYQFNPGTATTAGTLNTSYIAQGNTQGISPVISASGTANPVLWGEDLGGVVRAYTVPGLVPLYDSAMNAADAAPTYVKFTTPVVANGKVYVSGQGSLAVYGLRP